MNWLKKLDNVVTTAAANLNNNTGQTNRPPGPPPPLPPRPPYNQDNQGPGGPPPPLPPRQQPPNQPPQHGSFYQAQAPIQNPPPQYSQPPAQQQNQPYQYTHAPPQNNWYTAQPIPPPAPQYASPPPPPPQQQPYVPPAAQGPRKCVSKHALGALAGELVKYTPFYELCISEGNGTGLTVCEACFHRHVANTPMAGNFRRVQAKSDSEEDQDAFRVSRHVCDLSYTRPARIWHLECVPQRSVVPLVNYATEAASLAPCAGPDIREGGAMYEAINNAIPNFGMCSTCYEKYFGGTPYAIQFKQNSTMAPETKWICDIGNMAYLRDLIDRALLAHENDFGFFAHYANYRMNLPPCPGDQKPIQFLDNTPAQQRIAFMTSLGIGGTTCQACFADKIYGSSLENSFQARECPANETCDLALPPSQPTIIAARKAGDLQVWQNAVKAYLADTPPCAGAGGFTDEEQEALREKAKQATGAIVEWHALTAQPTLEICPRCFASYVVPFRAAHLFTHIDRPLRAGGVRVCNFSNIPSTEIYSKRCMILRETIYHGWNTGCGDFYLLFKTAKLIAEVGPPCALDRRAFKRPSGRKWFAHVASDNNDPNDCTLVVCEECYNEDIKETAFVSLFREVTDEIYNAREEVSCGPYSKRAKGYLKEAAAKNDFSQFARYWRKRQEVRARTVVEIKYCQSMYQMQMQSKLSAYSNAAVVRGGASILEAVTDDHGQRYGNSTIGYNHLTRAGADADMMFHNANNQSWGDTDLLTRASMLEAEWRAVE